MRETIHTCDRCNNRISPPDAFVHLRTYRNDRTTIVHEIDFCRKCERELLASFPSFSRENAGGDTP